MAKTNADFSARLLALRNEIAAMKTEIARVDASPIPFDEARARIAPLVDEISERWTPPVAGLAHPALPSVEAVLQTATADVWTLSGLIANVARDGMIAVLTQALEVRYTRADAASCIPAAERAGRLDAIRRELFKLECSEERLICDAAVAGVTLDRRGDASPAAVFAVVDESAAA